MELQRIGTKFFNAYLIPIGKGNTWCLVDTGSKGDKESFQAQLEKRNIRPIDIKYIIITHAHADHVGLLKYVLKETGAQLIATKEIAERLLTGKNDGETRMSTWIAQVSSRMTGAFAEKFHYYPPVDSPYISLADNPLSGSGIRLFFFAGHTDCDVCVQYKDCLLCGDLFSNLSPFMRLMPFWVKDKNELMRSWKIISKIPNVRTIYCGHGKPFSPDKIQKAIEYWKYKGTFSF